MPKLFQRKYLRGKPGRKEQLIGAGLLGLVALIVYVFLLTGGLFARGVDQTSSARGLKQILGISEEPLFEVAPEYVTATEEPHELRVARSMLPALPDPWRRDEVQAVEIAPPPEHPADANQPGDGLDVLAHRYGARWKYSGRYTQADDATLNVTVIDCTEPANAFGLCAERKAPESEPLPLSRAAWIRHDPPTCGFWRGRYYTELVLGGAGDSMQALRTCARTIASNQLAYGSPFWSERVLPSENRVDDSLRYVREEPLGLSELADCWLADYEGGVTLGVMEASERARERMLADLSKRLSKPQDTGGYGASGYGESGTTESKPEDEETISGEFDGRTIVASSGGPYLFIAVGDDDSGTQTLLAAAREPFTRPAVGGMAVADATRETLEKPGVARFVEVPDTDLVKPIDIETYTDDLYEKINGKEGMFRSFHFVELRFGRYQHPQREETYDVYLFDQGKPANALGIYMAERSRTPEFIPVGREGYVSGSSAYFWKGKYYVNVLGPEEGDDRSTELARSIAAAIAETIADDEEPFWADALLPREDRVEKSFSYKATSALGYEFLNDLYFADYQTDDTTYQMFLIRTGAPDSAAQLFEQYAEATKKYDKILSREPIDGGETMVGEGFDFSAVFHKGVYFGGVGQCADQELAVAKAAELRANLDTSGPKSEPASEGGY